MQARLLKTGPPRTLLLRSTYAGLEIPHAYTPSSCLLDYARSVMLGAVHTVPAIQFKGLQQVTGVCFQRHASRQLQHSISITSQHGSTSCKQFPNTPDIQSQPCQSYMHRPFPPLPGCRDFTCSRTCCHLQRYEPLRQSCNIKPLSTCCCNELLATSSIHVVDLLTECSEHAQCTLSHLRKRTSNKVRRVYQTAAFVL